MQSTVTILLISGICVFLILFIIGWIIILAANRKAKRCSARSIAVVTWVNTFYSYIMEYPLADGRIFKRKTHMSNNFSRYYTGMQIEIRYNPNTPNEIVQLNVFGGKGAKLAGGILIGFGILTMLAILFLLTMSTSIGKLL
jgi:energy-coupling factor transporter transmembrane protein EcfT